MASGKSEAKWFQEEDIQSVPTVRSPSLHFLSSLPLKAIGILFIVRKSDGVVSFRDVARSVCYVFCGLF